MLAGSVDTNVLVRLLTQDDEQQAHVVDRLLKNRVGLGIRANDSFRLTRVIKLSVATGRFRPKAALWSCRK